MPPKKKNRPNHSNEIGEAPLVDFSIVGSTVIEQLLQSETAAEKMTRLTVGEQFQAKSD